MEAAPYVRGPVVLQPWNLAAAEVVDDLRRQVQRRRPMQPVEHIGSTAVPGLPGKGIVDVMLAAEPDAVAALTADLEELGFRLSPGFPAARPLLLGSVRHDDDWLGVHVVPAGSDEVTAQRGLVQALRADAELRDAYAELKWSIVADGVTDPVPYSTGKIRWVLATLQRMGLPSLPDPGTPGRTGTSPQPA